MTDKTEDGTDTTDSRLKVEDLSAPEQELSPAEMEEVRGGDYVQGVYRDLLGRPPAQGNLNTVSGVAGGADAGGDRSGDGSVRSDAVKDMYNDLLNRPKP
jgi:hypothetical protein